MNRSDVNGSSRSNSKKVPFGGYYQRDVPPPDLELMQTGPGTPTGEFFRRFWQPVCLSEQITDVPFALRIMGEDLVAFRSRDGQIGLLNRHCSHRGASLEYGIVEESGLRCCYHGWLFGIDGTLLEAPGEPANSRLVGNLCHGAYPAFERSGLVFAYMGPPELKPQFQLNESFSRPGNKMVPYSNYFPCNWLQVQDNIVDPIHTAIFHNGIGNAAMRRGSNTQTMLPAAWGSMPVMDFRETQNGASMIYIVTRRVDQNVWVRMNHFWLPTNIDVGTVFSDGSQETYFQRVSFNRWVIPHDDESCSILAWRHFNDFVDKGKGDPSKLGVEGCDFLGGQVGGRPYDQAQRDPGDWDAIISQRKMARHGLENLGTTDVGVAMWRRLVRKAVRGESPAALPQSLNGHGLDSDPLPSYCQDTVMKIPALADMDKDRRMMREIGNRVADIVIQGDEYPPGAQRDAAVVAKLKSIHREFAPAAA